MTPVTIRLHNQDPFADPYKRPAPNPDINLGTCKNCRGELHKTVKSLAVEEKFDCEVCKYRMSLEVNFYYYECKSCSAPSQVCKFCYSQSPPGLQERNTRQTQDDFVCKFMVMLAAGLLFLPALGCIYIEISSVSNGDSGQGIFGGLGIVMAAIGLGILYCNKRRFVTTRV
jgi:hypothetical protein